MGLRTLKKIIKRKGSLFLAIALCVAINLAPTPPGLTIEGHRAVGLLALIIVLLFTEGLPLAGIAILIASYQILIGGRSFNDVPLTFMHDAVFFIIGALIMAVVLIKHNIHLRITAGVLGKVGTSVTRVVFGIIFITAILGMIIPGHIKAAILLPIGVAMVTYCGGYKKVPNLAKLLMLSITFGCKIGGVATPAGGARNVLMIGYLQDLHNVSLGFGQWMLYAAPFTLLMIPFVGFFLLRVFKPEIRDLSSVLDRTKEDLKKIGSMRTKDWMVILIFAAAVLLWITMGERLGIGHIAMLVALVYLGSNLVEWKDCQKGVNWGIVLLYMGAISLGRYLHHTGAALWLAQTFLTGFNQIIGMSSPMALVTATTLLTTTITNFMSDGPTVAILGPIVLNVGELAGLKPLVMGLSCAMASAFAWFLIIGTPSNAIVYSSGFLKPKDFLKAGWFLALVSMFILVVVIIGIYWRYVLHLW